MSVCVCAGALQSIVDRVSTSINQEVGKQIANKLQKGREETTPNGTERTTDQTRLKITER